MRTVATGVPLTLALAALASCASARPAKPVAAPAFAAAQRETVKPPAISVRPLEPAVPSGLVVALPLPTTPPAAEVKPLDRIAAANKAAIQEPRTDGYINAIQIFPYMEGVLYRLYTAPDRVSDVALQPGEQLIAISAGDTVRWVIGNTHSGAGTDQKVHILIKPQLAGLKTNLIIATDRRTYHLQMESTPSTAMAAVSWRYPQDELLAVQAAARKAEAAEPTVDNIQLDQIDFGYTISGATAPWRPVRAFNDGSRVYIEFPKALAGAEAPPLFIAGPKGQAQLVNYRVSRNFYIVDQLFAVAELRLGTARQVIVRITAGGKAGGRND